jgi:hypothetical protein
MGLGKEVWGKFNSSALKRKLKNCKTSICECLQEFLEEGMNDPHSGLPNRFARMLSPDAVASGVASHAAQIEAQQRGMKEAIQAHEDNGCPSGGMPARAKEYANKPAPTVADWEALHGSPMPQYSTMQKVGWGILGTAAAVGTVAAVISPFDGPAGDIGMGALTGALWRRALGYAF